MTKSEKIELLKDAVNALTLAQGQVLKHQIAWYIKKAFSKVHEAGEDVGEMPKLGWRNVEKLQRLIRQVLPSVEYLLVREENEPSELGEHLASQGVGNGPPPITSYGMEVEVFGEEGTWHGNEIRLATKDEAEAYAQNKRLTWMAVKRTRVVERVGPANYAWEAGLGLVAVPTRAVEAYLKRTLPKL